MKCETCGTQLLFVAHDGDDNVYGDKGDYFCPNPLCGDVEELVSDDATLVEEVGDKYMKGVKIGDKDKLSRNGNKIV